MLQVPDDGLTNKQRRNKTRDKMRKEEKRAKAAAAALAAALAGATQSPGTEAGSGPEHTGGSWDTPSRALLLGCLLSIHTRGIGEWYLMTMWCSSFSLGHCAHHI
jgi:hypothetical protein